MSSDLDTIKTMLAKANIHPELERPTEGLDAFDSTPPEGSVSLIVRADGYMGFFAEFVFRPDGSLFTIGCWE